MTNKYPGKCSKCNERVEQGEGTCTRVDGKWIVEHVVCPAEREAERKASTQKYLSTKDHCDGCHGTFYRGQLIKVEECWDGPYSMLCPDCTEKTWYGNYPIEIEKARNFQPTMQE